VSGKVLADTVVTLDQKFVKTVNGAQIKVSAGSNGVFVDGAKVVTTDIICDNGVIHVIDSVITPKPTAPAFNAKTEAGVSGPFGFFDPLSLCPDNKRDFSKFRESELKHGRVAMLAFLGIIIGESGFNFFGSDITGPAIYQFQQADAYFNAFTPNVIGLTLAIEGYNIVNGWESPSETSESESAIASLKPGYVNGDLKFDPLGFKPTSVAGLKEIQTKELNNGRLAMLAVAGIVAQELVTGSKLF